MAENIFPSAGGQKHHVTLELAQEDHDSTFCVSQLMKEVARVTEVPVKNQRLIVKGKSLTDPEASLKSCGVKNGTKLMLIGKKYNAEDEGFIKQISDIEVKVKRTEDKINEIMQEVDSIHKGFLSSDLQEEALKRLSKRVTSCTEEFSKQVECCDALTLSESTDEIRKKRKQLVNKILASVGSNS
ncbi:hypothetical protein LSH36_4g03039 [Paralvinella palmiformis]|uniref:BAG family molecular chaperone regulator 1 n=1 Tax=Paralvinella palmiformis TaxID=53620 RepID=A0AAD9NJ14_9ANNE|nr:hypothetical protein LSH36_4g03039 [Paralvinella palmiformis]